MNMVEKVARAICEQSGIQQDEMISKIMPQFINPDRFGVYGAHLKLPDDAFMLGWQYYKSHAIEAIKAMSNPTNKMVHAADLLCREIDNVSVPPVPEVAWEAMIAVALEEEHGEFE